MPYNPALDGLRAIAIALVILFHAKVPFFQGGFLGVDIFFVLSGYLITSLLLNEEDQTGQIHIGKFYIRRFFRLSPALLTMLIFYLAISSFLWPTTDNHITQAIVAATYLSDYGVAFWGVPNEIGHTWSLAVEEHFYLLWPLLLSFIYKRHTFRLLVILLGIYFATSLWRYTWIIYEHTWNQVYYRFDTRATGLILGSCLAVAIRIPSIFKKLKGNINLLIGVSIFTTILLQYAITHLQEPWGNLWISKWGFTLTEWSTLIVLLAIHQPQNILYKILSTPPFPWLGRLSYSLYLWHYPIFRYLRNDLPWYDVLLLGLPCTIVLAIFSYYIVESWGLKLRDTLKVTSTQLK